MCQGLGTWAASLAGAAGSSGLSVETLVTGDAHSASARLPGFPGQHLSSDSSARSLGSSEKALQGPAHAMSCVAAGRGPSGQRLLHSAEHAEWSGQPGAFSRGGFGAGLRKDLGAPGPAAFARAKGQPLSWVQGGACSHLKNGRLRLLCFQADVLETSRNGSLFSWECGPKRTQVIKATPQTQAPSQIQDE